MALSLLKVKIFEKKEEKKSHKKRMNIKKERMQNFFFKRREIIILFNVIQNQRIIIMKNQQEVNVNVKQSAETKMEKNVLKKQRKVKKSGTGTKRYEI